MTLHIFVRKTLLSQPAFGRSSLLTPFHEDGKRRVQAVAHSAEEAAEIARVVGYLPGLGSCLGREE
jgi:hypothetical protein